MRPDLRTCCLTVSLATLLGPTVRTVPYTGQWNLVQMKTYTTHASSATGTLDPRVPAAKQNRLHRPRVQSDCAELGLKHLGPSGNVTYNCGPQIITSKNHWFCDAVTVFLWPSSRTGWNILVSRCVFLSCLILWISKTSFVNYQHLLTYVNLSTNLKFNRPTQYYKYVHHSAH